MSNLVHNAEQEFWRPPLTQSPSPAIADSCRRCGTEFMVGAAFCHICGMNRHRPAVAQATDWNKYLAFFRTVDFASVKRRLELPMPALCAFLLGGAFLLLALSVGLVNAEFEAIQLWRIEWLIAACAAFLAGILLKGHSAES